ncbi:hypothetical protein AVEN_270564-1 [Araneus ventricosus]|uniref:Uncharacterized protein n=1 Tax=Araneus ventricosus TaxID=182803 RepID=A0A4Y2B4M1_ARAVE|nr:hypothetical protein AVEN_270564-1 [Araneus ventricosus]
MPADVRGHEQTFGVDYFRKIAKMSKVRSEMGNRLLSRQPGRADESAHCTEQPPVEFSNNFPQLSRPFLSEIITMNLLFRKFSTKWLTENLTPEHLL